MKSSRNLDTRNLLNCEKCKEDEVTLTPTMLSSQDKYLLSRWFTGLNTQVLGVEPSAFVTMLLSNLDSSKPDDLAFVRRLLSDHLADIFQQDPNGQPPIARPAMSLRPEEDAYIPPLLPEARLSDKAMAAAESVAPWYYQTVEWAKQRSPMTPPHFLEAGVVWLLSLAIARRACIEFHERIFPVLYLLLVAETSKYAKSTGLNTLYTLVMAAMPHMLIPGQTSPEGMIELLSGQLPTNFDKLSRRDQQLIEAGRKFAGQRGIMLDEYSSLLGSQKKDYMQGFIELLMRLYDAREFEQHYTRSGGMMIIKYPGISILGATTPAAMARACTVEMWENGANARYLIMFRDQPQDYNPNYISYAPPPELVRPLAGLHNALPLIKANDLLEMENDDAIFHPHFAAVSKEAHKQYMAYTKAVYHDMIDDELDERLHGNYRRMHVQALKIALALACMDWAQAGASGRVTIEIGHFALAQQLVETARESLHRLMPVLSQSADSRTHRDLLNILRHTPEGMTVRDIVRRTGKNTSEVRSALEVLAESGEIEVSDYKPSTGRPTQIYRLMSMI